MKSDGQLYEIKHKGEDSLTPPGAALDCEFEVPEKSNKPRLNIDKEQLLIIGIIVLILSDKCETDLPLVLALIYILFAK